MQRDGSTRRSVRMLAPAKVNLHLEVLRRRRDGYHEIETILQAVALEDRIRVVLSRTSAGGPCEIELSVQSRWEVPDDERNLCWRAARLFGERLGVSGQLQIELVKEIPPGAGLGGGSSDAMAVLAACDHLFGTGLDASDLERLGAELGSDVPFFARGGTQLARGRGTELTPLPGLRRVRFVVFKPPFAVDTGSAYEELKMGLTVHAPVASLQVIKPLLARFPRRSWFGFNRFEEVVLPVHPELGRLLLRLREEAAVAMLCGSGSAIYGVCEHPDQAERLVAELGPSMDVARSVNPLDCGVRLLKE